RTSGRTTTGWWASCPRPPAGSRRSSGICRRSSGGRWRRCRPRAGPRGRPRVTPPRVPASRRCAAGSPGRRTAGWSPSTVRRSIRGSGRRRFATGSTSRRTRARTSRRWFRGYGNLIIVDHGGEYYTVYAHAADIRVTEGDEVKQGQIIGTVGDTGSLQGPRLYFEVRHEGKPQDPAQWLRPKG